MVFNCFLINISSFNDPAYRKYWTDTSQAVCFLTIQFQKWVRCTKQFGAKAQWLDSGRAIPFNQGIEMMRQAGG